MRELARATGPLAAMLTTAAAAPRSPLKQVPVQGLHSFNHRDGEVPNLPHSHHGLEPRFSVKWLVEKRRTRAHVRAP